MSDRQSPNRAERRPAARREVASRTERAAAGARRQKPLRPPIRSPRKLALEVHRRLLERYGKPTWRTPLPPVDELVSTILSQNTNDDNRDRAFNSLRARFPSWEAVRDAPPEAVIQAIRSAGLANQKGPRIQAALQAITAARGQLELGFLGEMTPEAAREWLLQLKGVGPKTAAIVLQFSLGIPAFPVDTHIHRVSGRLGLRPENASAERTHALLAELFPPETYYDAHLNLIEHGRQVCKARQPLCERCPLTNRCRYYRTVVGPQRKRVTHSG